MRVVVTLIGPDGTMRRRMVDIAASSDTGPWEELLARALAALPSYRAVPGGAVCHLASMTRLSGSPRWSLHSRPGEEARRGQGAGH
jgi:hypothetical protein